MGPPHSSPLIPYVTRGKISFLKSLSQPGLPSLTMTDVKQQRLHACAAGVGQLMLLGCRFS